jgi:hypothetical protein
VLQKFLLLFKKRKMGKKMRIKTLGRKNNFHQKFICPLELA